MTAEDHGIATAGLGAPVEEPHEALLEMAWGIIANAGWDEFAGRTDLPKGGGWLEAAVRWREDYHRWLDLHKAPGGWQSWEELGVSVIRERDALFSETVRLQAALRDATSPTAAAIKEPEDPHRPATAEEKLARLRSVLLEGGQDDATARRRAIAIVDAEESDHG